MAGRKFPYTAAYVACRGDGSGRCAYGCIGCGACLTACKCGAVKIENGRAAVIDREKCRSCGLCVKACPQGIIHINETASPIAVLCSNRAAGREAAGVCPTACIGCGSCERSCSAEAVTVKDFLAVIREDLCLSCGLCLTRCPRHAIGDLRGLLKSALP